MDPKEELRDIVARLTSLMDTYRQIGLDPPPLSNSGTDYLRRNCHQVQNSTGSGSPADLLEALKQSIGDCTKCKLYKGRTNIVFGEGSPNARLVFVGEAPGREEDRAGRPFVGDAGNLLTRIIGAMGLTREDVYICNVVKCRPPQNRDPEKDEIETCIPFLKQQLRIIRPETICALGRVAIQGLLGKHLSIKAERGKWLEYMGIPLMPTYHPAYLLRNRSAKRLVWEDVQKIMRHLGLLESERNK